MDDNQANKPEQLESMEQIEEAVEASTNVNSDNKVERIMSLENMINGYLMDLEKLQKDLKEQSAMLTDVFGNDAEYAAATEKAKEVQKMKKEIKDKLISDPSVALLDAKVNDLKAEVKDARQALSDYLHQYYLESGLTQITDSAGEVREIVTSVKLVKKKD